MNLPKVLTVTQVTTYIKALLEGDRHLNPVMIRGEVSNFSGSNASGHFYFTLKDNRAGLRAVMFKTHAASVRFVPQNGMSVIAGGSISLFERDGQYQLYCTDLIPGGIGALALAYEQTKARLETEGLFDPRRKRPLPPFPQRVAVVTSRTGAAYQDILSVLRRRYPSVQVLLCPVTVQGEDAAASIIQALAHLGESRGADVILLARGGGSYEDLYAFNDESMARAIANSPIPVVSAVGHETDVTLADYAADLRAPTPSVGAELVVPDASALMDELFNRKKQMLSAVLGQIEIKRRNLITLSNSLHRLSPAAAVLSRAQILRQLSGRLASAMHNRVSASNIALTERATLLESLSPLSVLRRGYAVARINGRIIKNVNEVQTGDRVTVHVSEGTFKATVI